MDKFLFMLIAISITEYVLSDKLSCIDENGKAVDWFINYKLPKLEERSDVIRTGLAYAFLAGNKRSSKWILSSTNVSSPTSMLGYTLKPFYENSQEFTYLFYNDDNPDSESSSVGHTKGIVLFDQNSGVWIIHSIPKFPSTRAYSYPSNALENGQSVLCITFKTESLNEIGKQLLYNAPSIYAKQLTISGLDDDVQSLFSDKPAFVRKEPFSRVTRIKSKKNKVFTIFAKDNQFNQDLYSAFIAPELNASLMVETWRRGSGTRSDPSCKSAQQVIDILSINLPLHGKGGLSVRFSSMEDHSKWAVSMDPDSRWICIGDINRMESQKKRGGGAACFSSSLVWKAFSSSIESTEKCPNT